MLEIIEQLATQFLLEVLRTDGSLVSSVVSLSSCCCVVEMEVGISPVKMIEELVKQCKALTLSGEEAKPIIFSDSGSEKFEQQSGIPSLRKANHGKAL